MQLQAGLGEKTFHRLHQALRQQLPQLLFCQSEQQAFLRAQGRQGDAFGPFFPAVAVWLGGVVAIKVEESGESFELTLNGAHIALVAGIRKLPLQFRCGDRATLRDSAYQFQCNLQ